MHTWASIPPTELHSQPNVFKSINHLIQVNNIDLYLQEVFQYMYQTFVYLKIHPKIKRQQNIVLKKKKRKKKQTTKKNPLDFEAKLSLNSLKIVALLTMKCYHLIILHLILNLSSFENVH